MSTKNILPLKVSTCEPENHMMDKYWTIIRRLNEKQYFHQFIFEHDGVYYYVEWNKMKWSDPKKITVETI